MLLKSISASLILIAIVILLLSLKPALNLTKNTQQKNGWKVLAALVFLFILGYAFFLWSILISQTGYTEFSATLVLFGGSCFVNIVCRMSEKSILFAERIAALERHNSLHDQLTGLPNRQMLHDKLDKAIKHASDSQSSIYVFLIDLDRFKEVNDTLGHHIGDKVLQHVAPKLVSSVREHDTIARLGGDEFAIMLPKINLKGATRIAENIIKQLDQYIYIEQHRLKVSLSIGICSYPDNGLDTDTLMQKADVAMYVAKKNHNSFKFYSAKQDIYSLQRLKLSQELEKTISDKKIDLYYQPIIDIKSNTVKGFEALSRWKNIDNEFISPSDFIPLAEQTGWIQSITINALEKGIKQLANWHNNNIDCSLAINISLKDFNNIELVNTVKKLLLTHQIKPKNLILEITESSIMSDIEQVQSILTQLSKLGVIIAIDDFGTGYSSLSHLKNMPVNIIKIDKSFVFELIDDENDAIIVRSTIDLAHNMKKTVVAEGVKNKEIFEILEILGCDCAQGYYYSEAMPADKVIAWVNEFNLTKDAPLMLHTERRQDE